LAGRKPMTPITCDPI